VDLSDAKFKLLYLFSNELQQNTGTSRKNYDYRTQCLRLIEKYFDFSKIAFNIFNNLLLSKKNIHMPNLDNVTFGLSSKLLQKYYTHYYREDPLNLTTEYDVFELTDIISKKDYEKTDYYKNFSMKYGINHQCVAIFQLKDQILGALTFFHDDTEGDFTDEEIETIRQIRNTLLPGLMRSLEYETLQIENFALKEYSRVFPFAQIILDHNYNVKYFNETAELYCIEMTGAKPSGFKSFFVNRIKSQISYDNKSKETTLDYHNFRLKVMIKIHDQENVLLQERYYVVVYIMKINIDDENFYTAFGEDDLLSPREKEIVGLLRRGLPSKVIAEQLSISNHTVKTHIQRIYKKYGVNNKAALLYTMSKSD
jgi:DNA-binding CsgD family transcriptional regulator